MGFFLSKKGDGNHSKRIAATIEVTTNDQPDVYGQIHAVETPTLVEESLKQFEIVLAEQPTDVSADAYLAERRCPDICNQQFKLIFLRTEVFRVDDAVRRYMKYWTKRIELFGADRAFKPLVLGNMTESEIAIMKSKYIYIVPATTLLPRTPITPSTTEQ
jgi:hypothetical protein